MNEMFFVGIAAAVGTVLIFCMIVVTYKISEIARWLDLIELRIGEANDGPQ